MKSKIAFVALCILCGNTFAARSAIDDVTITKLGYDGNWPNYVFIRTDLAPINQNRTGCHTDNNWNYVMDLANTKPKETYSAMLAAHASKSKVDLRGNDSCVSGLSIEQLHILYTN